jgi:BirA family biotin operon repressor/biotin-[acetyl-CoA-carboxylase] ligase
MADALERRCPGIHIGLKWPNDLQLGQRKLGGVLCEARWHGGEPAWVAVGLGLNVQNPVPDDLEATAIALASVVRRIGPTELEGDAITAIVEAGDRSGALTPRELAAYAVRDSLLGRQLLAPVAGVARGVGADGALLVEAGASGIRAIRSGKVQLVGG